MLLEIDFNNTNHQNYILKLSQRNNFHTFEMFLYMHNDKLKYGINPKYGGFFKVVNKKVVGFILTYTDEEIVFSQILYILVDKKYQSIGFGKELIQYHIDFICHNPNIKMVYVDAENETIKWYEKLGFYDEQSTLQKIKTGDVFYEETDKRFVIDCMHSIEDENFKKNGDYVKKLYYPLTSRK